MQIVSLSHKITPITLSAGLLLSANFMYSDFDKYSAIDTQFKNEAIENYISCLENTDNDKIRIQQNFHLLLKEWQRKTFLLSSVEQITNQQEFKEIVNMGTQAVPMILESIEREPSILVWALNCIYSTKISNNPNLTIEEACKLWVRAFTI